jgi:PTH1 family peptidyl-tRNA hydrolase
LRLGIGSDFPKGYQVDYVLGEWTPDELTTLSQHIEKAGEIILSFGVIGIEQTMNLYNKK